MDFIKELVRISFFRLFIPIIVGVTFSTILFLFFYIFFGNEYKNLLHGFSYTFSNIYKFSTLIGNVLVLSIFFIIGEFLSSLGEITIGFFFECYIPFNKINKLEKLEKLSPYLKEKLTYIDFINAFKQENTIVEISEVHYTMSRLFAGLALSFFVSMLLSLSLILWFLSLLVSLLLVICVFTHRYLLFRLSIDIDVILLFTSLVLLLTLFTDNNLTTNQTIILASLSFFFAFLTLSCIRISIFYRVHANKLIYYLNKYSQ